MRTLAELLYWAGRLESVALFVFMIHSLAVWHWREDMFKRWLGVVWLILFMAFSMTVFPNVLTKATDGTGYVLAHLYGGNWRSGLPPVWRSDEEALSSILLRWQNLWLPIYGLWLSVWLGGLISIPLLSAVGKRMKQQASLSKQDAG